MSKIFKDPKSDVLRGIVNGIYNDKEEIINIYSELEKLTLEEIIDIFRESNNHGDNHNNSDNYDIVKLICEILLNWYIRGNMNTLFADLLLSISTYKDDGKYKYRTIEENNTILHCIALTMFGINQSSNDNMHDEFLYLVKIFKNRVPQIISHKNNEDRRINVYYNMLKTVSTVKDKKELLEKYNTLMELSTTFPCCDLPDEVINIATKGKIDVSTSEFINYINQGAYIDIINNEYYLIPIDYTL